MIDRGSTGLLSTYEGEVVVLLLSRDQGSRLIHIVHKVIRSSTGKLVVFPCLAAQHSRRLYLQARSRRYFGKLACPPHDPPESAIQTTWIPRLCSLAQLQRSQLQQCLPLPLAPQADSLCAQQAQQPQQQCRTAAVGNAEGDGRQRLRVASPEGVQ